MLRLREELGSNPGQNRIPFRKRTGSRLRTRSESGSQQIRITKQQNRIAGYGMQVACQAEPDVRSRIRRYSRWRVACMASEQVLFPVSQVWQGIRVPWWLGRADRPRASCRHE